MTTLAMWCLTIALAVATAHLAVKTYLTWMVLFGSQKRFARRLAELRARHVDWREWRRR